MSAAELVRIDDGVRAKIVCRDCGRETYVPLLQGGAPTSVDRVVETLTDAVQGHAARCEG